VATILAFHAHPDDEVLLTGGTIAKLAAEGHRVVIVVATDGWMRGADEPGAGARLAELRASAAVLGATGVHHLGYADSGHGPVLFPDPPGRQRFVRASVDEAATRLAELIRSERADVLLSYDACGGYGHRDHLRVHEVGARAAGMTGVRVLEATVPRELVGWLFAPLRPLRLVVRFDPATIKASFTPRSAITHRVNVRPYARQKQAALAAHQSQVRSSGRAASLMGVLVALPAPLFGLVLGQEWFAERGAQNAASGRSMMSSVTDSAISRSAASRGSTVAAKNPAAATLPW
jgi:LmbE family N-acetylglucosaminyl deacetylase